jgi:hypothetical protein
MRNALLALSLFITVTTTAQARLGETPDQLVARYGTALSEKDQKAEGDKVSLADVIFQKGGYQIEVIVTDGISSSETFKKVNSDPVTLAEVRILLNANSQGFEWDEPHGNGVAKSWTRDDGATATLGQDGSVTIKSKELASKEANAKKLESKPSLDGF